MKASDGATGWVTATPTGAKKWSGSFRSQAAQTLQSTCKVDGAEAVREVAMGETFELVQGPVDEDGVMRMKGKAKKDGATGWLTIIDKKSDSPKRLMV